MISEKGNIKKKFNEQLISPCFFHPLNSSECLVVLILVSVSSSFNLVFKFIKLIQLH